MRSRFAFLTRLLVLKLMAFLTLVLLILYAPATTKTLWNGAGEVSVVLAKATDSSLQFIGSHFGIPPKQGAVELMSHIVGMDKVILFMGITIALYTTWLIFIGMTMSVFRRKPARLHPIGGSGKPQR